jgi:signal peptide peptidase SppA
MLHLHKIINGVWLIEQSFAVNYLPFVADFLFNPTKALPERVSENFLSIYSGDDSRRHISALKDAPPNSIAVVNICGAITKHDQYSGNDGMLSKAEIINHCYSNDNIEGIVLRIDSGGGEVMAMRLMMEAVGERNKPVVAFIDDYACSAAYGIASACDHIVANSEQARIGSIGMYTTIADYTPYFKKLGIEIKDIYATLSTHKNEEVREALNGNDKPLRQVIDTLNEFFITSIEKNREGKLTTGRDVWGTGKVWFAKGAIKNGLIDEINTFSNTLKLFI